ncbi:MAG: phoD [Acidimicrobiaceae bacterium]|nr:MAG: phoD [Acidimicrobiaceae bacterium]
MQPISRRLFLVSTVAVLVASCSDDQATVGTAPLPSPTDAKTPDSGSTVAPVATTVAEAATTTTSDPGPQFDASPFTLGVASGDPGVGSVVLWTRLALDPLAGGGMPADDFDVRWEMALDPEFTEIGYDGIETARPGHGHSVHVNATVDAGTWYYRFHAGGHTSPIGTTRTAPSTDAEPELLRFASASCQHYEHGFYTAQRDLADKQPDFAIWLGDYIYEGNQAAGIDGVNVRSHGTDEIVSIDDYRNRYALYKTDPDLQAAHAACPWYVIWDDHEVENNYAGLTPQDAADQAAFAQRRRDAYQAWWENQPVALPPPGDDPQAEYRIYRAARWGSLLNLTLLDGRQYRSDQACGDPGLSLEPACPETFDEARTMLGDEQEAWLFDELTSSTATWNVIGQQTVFGDLTLAGAVLNYDQWDGYPVNRNRILDRLAIEQEDAHADNVVVLTGDIHLAGTGTLRSGMPGTGTPVGVEFVATSISSGGLVDPVVTDIVKAFPDILDAELEHRGYILHTVTPTTWLAEYRMVETVKERDAPMFVHDTYRIDVGTNTVGFAQA